MPRLPLLLSLAVLALPACDQKSDDELRAMMGDVAQNHMGSVTDDVEQLEKAQKELDEKIAALDGMAERVATLEADLAKANERLAALEAGPPKLDPTPTVRPGRPDPAETYKVDVGDGQAIGPDTALVTIVAFSDFQCPFCSRVTPTLEGLRKKYGSDLRVVFKHNPLAFHRQALPAAKAAEAAGEQGKFWEMHDKLFANQRDLTDSNFVKWAKELKLDVGRFEKDMADARIARRIEEHQAQSKTLGATGTPSFFVNGRFLSGAQPQANFERLVDEELADAKLLVASGTPRDRVYEETIRGGKTGP